jgi:hypothetical protein
VLSDYGTGTQISAETGRRSYDSDHAWAGPKRIYRADAASRLLRGPWYW